MRAFVALEVPEAFEDEVAGVARQLMPSVQGRFSPRENYHVTLAFLGEIGEAEARGAMDALDGACAGRHPVELRAQGLGHFGRPRDATLWLGLQATEELTELCQAVREGLRVQGIAFDEKAFRPHLTIARRARLLQGELPQLMFPQPARASRVTLFRSTLLPEGARYKPLYTVELG